MAGVVTLVNANEMRPPVAPLALDYLGAALAQAGFTPRLLDLTWADDQEAAVRRHFADEQPLLVGLTLRNTDDCYMAGQYSCLPQAQATVQLLRRHTDAPLVVGGCGFSLFPELLVTELGADYGISGEGEAALPELAQCLQSGEDPRGITGLVYRDGDAVQANPRGWADLAPLRLSARALLDNARYWREGGQGGFETKRGCDRGCIYCADPVAKGRMVRRRDPRDVATEVATLARQGVVHLHTCDSEFNVPRAHALAVCEALVAKGLGEQVRWYAYCTPGHFDRELAGAMRRAGCVGVNFGADHGTDEQLARLGRDHRVADLRRTVEACRDEGLVCMFDLLFGAPGDTREAVRATLELMQELQPDRVGISTGVRLYPGTPLAARVARPPLREQPGLRGHLDSNDSLLRPVFYVAPELGEDIGHFIGQVIAGDQRFFCPDPAADLTDYNYRENTVLTEAIAAGHRGAYWDILRRLQEGLAPA
ncbi:MAG: radical SAM protein [Armatimonadetes bacterium]|nr:radical SAM protein [Armatimonadota bacterium]